LFLGGGSGGEGYFVHSLLYNLVIRNLSETAQNLSLADFAFLLEIFSVAMKAKTQTLHKLVHRVCVHSEWVPFEIWV